MKLGRKFVPLTKDEVQQMETLQDEATQLALNIGKAYCHEAGIPQELWEDCLQEGVLAALSKVGQWEKRASLLTFLYPWVRGAIHSYAAKQENGGMGGKDASPALVSLHDEIPGMGAADFDGDPPIYENTVSYDTPPRGYGDPLDEMLQDEEENKQEAAARLIEKLAPGDAEIARMRFLQDMTFQQIANQLGVTTSAVQHREKTILRRLGTLARVSGL